MANLFDQQLQDDAWLGDAILALFVRQLMITNSISSSALRGELYAWFTSNQFLSGFGRPTEVEAKIGIVYREQGLESAFGYIKTALLPMMQKQLPKRIKPGLSLNFEKAPDPFLVFFDQGQSRLA